MFGFDLVSIIAAAIGGAIGGALGGLIASRVGGRQWRAALPAGFAVLGVALSNPLIKPQIETYFGSSVRAEQFDATYEAEVVPELKKIPALERIFRENTQVEKEFREKARAAYLAGGPKGLVEQSVTIGATVLGDAFISYMPRARGEDLILFARTMADTLAALNEKDPEACILYQFGTTYGRPLANSRLVAAIGEEGQSKILAAMNAVVVNAGDQPVAFDKAAAQVAMTDMARRHAPLLTGKSGDVASGARPPADVAEANAACSFGVALYKDLASMDAARAELILRLLLTPS